MQDPVRDALARLLDGEPIVEDGRWIVRLGLAAVMIVFGIDKFVHPGYWPMWVPDALWPLATPTGIAAIGVVEIVLGLGLLSGRGERLVALTTAGYLAAVVASQGATLVALRDLGLAAAAAYLGLTAEATPIERPSGAGLSLPDVDRTRVGLAVGLLVAALAVGAVAWSWPAADEPTGDLLAFRTPEDGAALPAGEVPVAVELDPRVDDLGVDHMHIRIDGGVVDAVYFADGDDVVETTIHLDAGEHTVGAYLAYTDHVEYEDSWTEVTVTAT